jgi:hypothetical protein
MADRIKAIEKPTGWEMADNVPVFGRICHDVPVCAGETMLIKWTDYFALLGVPEAELEKRSKTLYAQLPKNTVTRLDIAGKKSPLYMSAEGMKAALGKTLRSKVHGPTLDALREAMKDAAAFRPTLDIPEPPPKKEESALVHPALVLEQPQCPDHKLDKTMALFTEDQLRAAAESMAKIVKDMQAEIAVLNSDLVSLKAGLQTNIEQVIDVALRDDVVRGELLKALLDRPEAKEAINGGDAMWQAYWEKALGSIACIVSLLEREPNSQRALFPVVWDLLMMEFDREIGTNVYKARHRGGDETLKWKDHIRPKGLDYMRRMADFMDGKRAQITPSH